MPNTLAHIGIQGLLSRSLIRRADPKWIYLGAVIPDVPWIVQRVIASTVPGIDTGQLRLYLDVQASLFGSLILCAALALLARQHRLVFVLLGLNVFLHLVLDALQTKWGNGVHFFAPFSWEWTNWGLFWPESVTTYLLTGFGFGYILWHWRMGVSKGLGLASINARRMAASAGLAVAYVALPFALMQGPTDRDTQRFQVSSPDAPVGRYVEFDRAHVVARPEGNYLMCCMPGGVRVKGLDLTESSTVSLRGHFVSEVELQIVDAHIHLKWFRDGASIVGLLLVTLLWIHSTVTSRSDRSQDAPYASSDGDPEVRMLSVGGGLRGA